MKRVTVFIFVMMALVGISGCETMEGLGKDISKLGDKIENAADK